MTNPSKTVAFPREQNREPRRHPPYACEGYAEVFLPHGGLLFRGRILDLSMSGCYIETALLNLERGTQVEVYFVTNQLQFRVLGNVAVVTPQTRSRNCLPECKSPAGPADCDAGRGTGRAAGQWLNQAKSPLESGLFVCTGPVKRSFRITMPHFPTRPERALWRGCHA